MSIKRSMGRTVRVRPWRRLAVCSSAMTSASLILVAAAGIAGPSEDGVVPLRPEPPWPPWFLHLHPSSGLVSALLWLAVLLGATGLTAGLLAVRRGWRPHPRRLVAGSAVAVAILMVVPPVANSDPVMYAAYGRIAVLGHSPYITTQRQLISAPDGREFLTPVSRGVPPVYQNSPSRYGPVYTLADAAASVAANGSVGRTLFWLKVWNALSYLLLVLVLDRATRRDSARRARAHLMWSVNPLMLLALMGNGHNDVLAAAMGVTALYALRIITLRRALAAGVLAGLAIAVKAPYALFCLPLAWTARRSRKALIVLAFGVAAVLVPSYLAAGRAALTATLGLARAVPPDLLWHDAATLLGWQGQAMRLNALALIISAVLAITVLCRMPLQLRTVPAAPMALALSVGFLTASPLQGAAYDAMIVPLLAMASASRLDWVVVMRATVLAAASVPFIYHQRDPAWAGIVGRLDGDVIVPIGLAVAAGALLWLCITRDWRTVAESTSAAAETFAMPGAASSLPG